MIGLGSNRLTVCRRGGMSVTQAGRGGMEWLAGFRAPSWASPYSAAATAALKAQFSAEQWPTIRDYGFAHPEIVGYMNAYAPEDAKIAYSLVPTLGVIRKITPIGNAYLKTGYKANGNTGFYIDFYSVANTSMCIFGGRTAHNNLSYAMTPYREGSLNGQFYYAGNLGKVMYNAEIYNNNRCIVKYDAATHKFTNAAGTEISTSAQTFTIDYDIYLFADNQKNSMIEHFSGDICVMRFDELGVDKRYYVPFIRNGQNEMLDLVTGQLAERVGSFTISETPAS